MAGGNATRLRPLTWVTNKHLLPVYNKPMIFYPIETMAKAGIKDVLIITGPDHMSHFIRLLKTGRDFGVRIAYDVQDQAGGLSQAVSLAEEFAKGDSVLVLLGDNIFKHDLGSAVKKFEATGKGAVIFAKPMPNASEYGVVELDANGKVLSIEEKPKQPKSDLVQLGIYIYDPKVFEYVKTLKPSARGELEITDLNNCYLREGTLSCEIMEDWWVDAGTSFDELLRANQLVAEEVKKNGSLQ